MYTAEPYISKSAGLSALPNALLACYGMARSTASVCVCSINLQDMILSLARAPLLKHQQQQQVPLARRGSVLTMAEGTALARPRFGSFNQVA
jgi:hypothetical protein